MSLLWPILRHALTSPRRLAAIDDRRRYTYAQVVGGAFYVAHRIAATTQRRHVGIMLPTSGAFPLALLGTWLAKRVAVPFNYLLARDELNYVIRDSDVDTLITAGPMLDFLEENDRRDAIPDDVRIVRLEDLDFTGAPEPRWPPLYGRDELAVILYTSGTSGRPKGVMLSHGNLRSNADAGIRHASITRVDTFLGVLPQFHSFGLTALTLIPLRLGATTVYSARFVPRKIVDLIRKHRPDIMMAVPSMYGALLSVKQAGPDDFKSIRLPISGGEPLPDATYQACLDRFDLEILEGYGLTETSPATHWSTPQHKRRHSVGLPLPGVRQFILDEHDHVLPPNEEGEIVLAGPHIMLGYYKMPDQTRRVIFELTPPGENKPVRAFRTGDIGRVDEDGYLYITGRKKDMLIIGGENVSPREIEEVLNRHSTVRASAVIGKQDGMRGEVPVAFVEVQEDTDFDESAVRSFCREHLAQYKVPREVRVVDELPRGPTGKILRRELSTD